jgi:integrase/recombinase XerD
MENEAPLDVIPGLLGHENSETTRVNAQLSGNLEDKFRFVLFSSIRINLFV